MYNFFLLILRQLLQTETLQERIEDFSVFPGQPRYLTVVKPLERYQATTTIARRAKEGILQHIEEEKLGLQRDAVCDLNDLENAFTLPHGFEKILYLMEGE